MERKNKHLFAADMENPRFTDNTTQHTRSSPTTTYSWLT